MHAQNPKAEARLVQELLNAPESALLTGGQGDAVRVGRPSLPPGGMAQELRRAPHSRGGV